VGTTKRAPSPRAAACRTRRSPRHLPRETRSADTTPDEAAPVVAQEVVAEIEVVPDTPPPLFTREHGRVVIEEARIQRGLVTPEGREQLIAVLEELLMRVRRV
jgi:hypothetical protein